uniref:Uncharacterized protein n=1 Tax=Meloidogyne enterolobii TaxID=390850 RepID=A0A6V7UWD0_MELEN|nr:unnamed protein product [Meloidogyne enterolobii]
MNQFTTVFSIIFLIICLIISTATFLIYRIKVAKKESTESSKIKIKLLVYALITLFGHVLVAIMLVLFWILFQFNVFGDNLITKAVYQQYPWVMDTSTLVLSSWSLLWASDTFRHEFTKFYLPKIFWKKSVNKNSVEPINLINLNTTQKITKDYSPPTHNFIITHPNFVQ